MRRFLYLFVLLPIAVVVVTLSVANRETVTLAFDPIGDPPLWSVSAPLYLMLFVTFGLGGLLGGIATWIRQSKWRQTARTERANAARLRQEVERLHQKARTLPSVPVLPEGRSSRDAA